MSNDLFAKVPKKKFIAYGSVLAAMIVGFALLMLFLGESPQGVLRMSGVTVLVCAVLLIPGIWLTGGKKTGVRAGSSTTQVPVRLRAAMPFIIGLIIFSQLLRLLALLGDK